MGDVQSPILRILFIVRLFLAGLDVDAARVECALNTIVLIPATLIVSHNQRAIERLETGRCGRCIERKSLLHSEDDRKSFA